MITENKNGEITTSIMNNTAWVEFCHPAANSLPSALLKQLSSTFNTLAHNHEVHVIVLKSSGNGTFCAGASFTELQHISNYEEGAVYFSGFANVINAMRACGKIIIGAIQGKAAGGGVGLIAACDYAIATVKASIRLPEINIGIGPFVIAPAIIKKCGTSALAEMSLDTEWKSSDWALQKGFYNKILPTVELLTEEVNKMAAHLSAQNPEALYALKKIFWEGTDDWDQLLSERAKITGRLAMSEFTKNALDKFK
ncbi:enoyl-CoA hydratase/isomerase family protein [Flavobacterium rhizosphaerae]|uniref:Enoyl-CoA hydratase/isomerase family protein n=1 Tax=Flavobacterium rhizosphaerae TaxID=3163298 RepID=A0ABW8Z0Y4_9FLAO